MKAPQLNIAYESGCEASLCHISVAMLMIYPPISGKHAQHLGSRNNITCGDCHSAYLDNPLHKNGVINGYSWMLGQPQPGLIVYFDPIRNPGAAWDDSSSTCANLRCHPSLDWNSNQTPTCSMCHKSAVGTRRQVFDSNGDGTGTGGDFKGESHHVINYINRTTQIVQDTDCKVCHDMNNHMGGSLRLRDKDTPNVIVYNPSAPNSLETFCLSCHDSDGATTQSSPKAPFSGGTAGSPNVLGQDFVWTNGPFAITRYGYNQQGDKIKGYWNNTRTIHKDNNLTCMGSGEPNTGCHGSGGSVNGHGSANRGLLAKSLGLPVTKKTDADGNVIYDYNDYKLCFDCHDSYPDVSKEVVLGYKVLGTFDDINSDWYPQTQYNTSGMKSNFREVFIPPLDPGKSYNEHMFGPNFFALHNYHLLDSWQFVMWSYRGNPDFTQQQRLNCTTCHNVHGTDNTPRSTYTELGIVEYTNGNDKYGKFTKKTFTTRPTGSGNSPVNCGRSCHLGGEGYYWYNMDANIAIASPGHSWESGGSIADKDNVNIIFPNSTNGPMIDESNIDTVLSLSLSGHTWLDTDKGGDPGVLRAVWSDYEGKTNNVLTITIFVHTPAPDPTVAAGDTITFDGATIIDQSTMTPISGSMVIKGSF